MTAKLPTDPDGLYRLIEPLFGPLNEQRVDYAALRAKLPAAKATSKRMRAKTIDDAVVVAGSAVIDGGILLEDGAALVVLGDLHVKGAIYSPPHSYSFIVVGGTLEAERVHTSGDVIAFGGIRARLWWASYNDHSAWAPSLDADVYIASDDRSDVVRELRAKTKIVGFDVDAELTARFPELDPKNDESIRAFVGLSAPKPRKAGKTKPDERDAIRAELEAAWALADRPAKVKSIRAVYATIKKRRLADCGELLVEMIAKKREHRRDQWSIQDELELLATLRRADLLESLPAQHIAGCESWMPGLLETARK